MSCHELSDMRLWELLDDELAAGDRTAVEQHLTTCSHCSSLVDEMRRRPLAIGGETMVPPSVEFHQRVMELIDRERHRPWLPGFDWLAPLLAPARLATASVAALFLAALSLTAVAGLLVLPAPNGPPSSISNNLIFTVQAALAPARPVLGEWAWLIVLIGMAIVVITPVLGLLLAYVRRWR